MTPALVLVALVVLVLWAAKAVLEARALVEWSDAEEAAAIEVARTLGVTLEEARLAVIAWRGPACALGPDGIATPRCCGDPKKCNR